MKCCTQQYARDTWQVYCRLWLHCKTHLDEMLYTEEVSASHGYKEWGVAPLVLQVDARACLQQKGDAAQVAYMKHVECLYSMRGLCNQGQSIV